MTDVTPATDAVSPDTTTSPAAPAETVQSADTQITPQGDNPAGTEDQSQQSAPKEEQEKQPTPAETARKQRNKERWQRMKQEASDARRREQFYLSEIERLKTQQPDFSKMTDPDEILAAKTAQHFRQNQVQDHESRARHEAAQRDQAIREGWSAMAEDMRAKAPDFDQVFNANTPVHAKAVPFIVESDKGGEIAYFLGKNPDVARDLYSKFETAPAQALIELGRIEARMSAPPPKQVSTAPKPAPILNGGVNPLAFDGAKASVEDMAAHLKKAGLIR